ncbi:hypothetical protein H5410_040034 [Solanum commersonii]|uniref:Uncharacterized protein n=1 Tax=Solanum commersonii TaxID=4109 RepID=A0A9J5XQX5_SOLCO|nr:hypothetical protein H5410_040034 [Solanum commersonii]
MEVHASYKTKDAKIPKKRGRKVASPISRPTLPMVSNIGIEYNFLISTHIPGFWSKFWDDICIYTFHLLTHFIQFILYLIPVCSDSGTYIDAFAEFLRDEIKISSIPFRSTDKAKEEYVSENDDPTRPKSDFLPSTDDEMINYSSSC